MENNIFDELRKKSVQEAIDAGFSPTQAEFLTKRFGMASMGLGGMFF